MGASTAPRDLHASFACTATGKPTLIRAPPAVFVAPPSKRGSSSEPTTISDYSASIPDAPGAALGLDVVLFERDERPRNNSATVPRHSPLPAARPPTAHARPPAAPDGLFVVDRPGALQRLRAAATSTASRGVAGGPGSRRSSATGKTDEVTCGGLVTSFVVGVCFGLLPVLLLLVGLLGRPRLARDSARWDQRAFVYGRSVGLFVLIVVAIAVVTIVVVA